MDQGNFNVLGTSAYLQTEFVMDSETARLEQTKPCVQVKVQIITQHWQFHHLHQTYINCVSCKLNTFLPKAVLHGLNQ